MNVSLQSKKITNIFTIPLVRHLFYAIILKIVGLTILYMLFFSPPHRISVDKNIIFHDIFQNE